MPIRMADRNGLGTRPSKRKTVSRTATEGCRRGASTGGQLLWKGPSLDGPGWGHIMESSGASPQAVRRLKRCVASSGASPQAVRRLKRCVASSGASPQAVRRLKRCVASSGASPQAVRRLKRCVASSGASPQAVRRLKRCVASSGASPFKRCVAIQAVRRHSSGASPLKYDAPVSLSVAWV